MANLKIPDDESPSMNKKKSPNPASPEPGIVRGYWIFFLLLCLMIIGGLWWFNKPVHPPEITQPQYSYTDLAELLCDKFNWCQTAQTTPAEVEAELRQRIPDEQQIRYLITSLEKETNVFSSLLLLSPQYSPQYLKDLTNFEKLNFAQIVEEQRKLREVFSAFQTFAKGINVPETMPDSTVAPLSSFAYKVTKEVENTQVKPETKLLPFFSDADVIKAKLLGIIVKFGDENKVFHIKSGVKVFTALCQLADNNVIEAGYDSENQLRDLCITPHPDKPAQQQCEILDDSQTKNMAEALLELRKTLKQQLSCEA